MSALVITNHVKEGVELGRKHGLPKSIIDIIPQHHGTKLISFFFEKARKTAKPDKVEVKEEEFRYPGPKPQTREAGIIMIADGVEASTRSLDDPGAGRLKGTIKSIIDSTFLDGQLDECDLTLKDLTKIADAFLKVLASMYHERIRYPESTTEKRSSRKGSRARRSERNRAGAKENNTSEQKRAAGAKVEAQAKAAGGAGKLEEPAALERPLKENDKHKDTYH